MIKAIIIDDEQNVREILNSLFADNFDNILIVGEADGVESGLKVIRETNPDLVLLDVKLKDGSSFEILKKLENIPFSIVFVTAYNEYAITAFKFSAIDYILKPIEKSEFIDAIHKVLKQQDSKEYLLSIKNYQENEKDLNEGKKIVLRTATEVYRINVKDIVRCEAQTNYTFFYLTDDRKIVVSRNIKHYSEILQDHNFFRVHKSHLINMDYFVSFKKKDGGFAVLKNKAEIPVSFRKRELLIKYISGS